MNPSESSRAEIKVGIFVLIGLLIASALVINFGRYGQGLTPRITLVVEFSNASGLLKNSKVFLAGAQIGSVSTAPRVLPGGRSVRMEVKIDRSIRVPKNAAFVVGSSGLLGDRFVDIIPKAEDPGVYFEDGDVIQGSRQAGMDDLTREGGVLIGDLRGAVANLNKTITYVREDLLKQSTFDKLEASMQNLQGATKSFQESSEKIGGLVTEARGAVADARTAIGGTKDTLDTAKRAAEDLRGAIADTRKVLASTRRAVDQATTGKGPVATLLTDKTLSDNLSALIANLRQRGILFYKDRPAAAPTEEGQRGGEERRR